MQYKKSVYLYNNKYYGKVEYVSADQYDLDLFTKYSEPLIDKGGSFTDGVTTFTLSSENRYIKTQSPFTQEFDPVTLSVTMDECGKRAVVYINTIGTRIQNEMATLRGNDSTSYETIKNIVI